MRTMIHTYIQISAQNLENAQTKSQKVHGHYGILSDVYIVFINLLRMACPHKLMLGQTTAKNGRKLLTVISGSVYVWLK